MKKHFKNYFWFIKESQNYMSHENSFIIFFKSLFKGFWFCYEMNKNKDGV